MHNNIRTVLTLDKETTLELGGARGGYKVEAIIKRHDEEGEVTESIEFSLSSEVLRNLSHALDGYR